MRGLTVIVAGRERSRLRTALTLAATQAAMGAGARLFLDEDAVALLQGEDGDDGRRAAAGVPTIGELLDTCLSLGVEVILCQSGLALAGLDLGALDPRLQGGGLASLLATLDDGRLLAI